MRRNKPIRHTSRAFLALTAIFIAANTPAVAKQNAILGSRNEPPGRQKSSSVDSGIRVQPVTDKVYMLVGAGSNITVQVSDEAVLVVDAGAQEKTAEIIAAIGKMSAKPILFIVDTNADDDHIGGNAKLSEAGYGLPNEASEGIPVGDQATRGQVLSPGASIIAHINVLNRVSAPSGKPAPVPEAAWPTLIYDKDDLKLYNGEPIIIHHIAAAHTDGDTIVFFRGSDVVSTGDVFSPSSYPVIDEEKGGTIGGIIDGLNEILDLLVPQKDEEGGTWVIPGHGHLCDRTDVVNYRDAMTIVEGRIQNMISQGMTLDQVKAAQPTLDYDGIYGGDNASLSSSRFIEGVYRGLSEEIHARPQKTPAGRP